MMKRKKHAVGGRSSGSTALRDAQFQRGVGPSSPQTVDPSPYRTRPFPIDQGRIPGRSNQPASSWEAAVSPALDNAVDEFFGDADSLESFTRRAEAKRREVGWSTSFPAEYYHAHQTRDYQQTLAYQEQVNQRKQIDQQLTKAVVNGVLTAKVSFPNAPSPNRQELELLKHVAMREGILDKLKALTRTAGATGFQSADAGTELLQLLLQLRDASVSVISAMAKWHQSITTTRSRATPPAFLYQGHNYCAKMVADLNFLAIFSSLGRVLGVDPTRMKQNPFMMPSPIPDRDFHEMQSYSASSPPQFRFDHAIDRVAEAEKYLVWSLVNLPEGISNASQSPHDLPQQQLPPTPLTAQGKRELLTWQQRAEQQLRVLSMPLESPSTGQARVMDSSRMMKRKGYLPSLLQSPSKTLTQLMESVHKGGYTSPTKSTGFASFEAFHDGISYRMTALDIELLGSNDEAPPHAIVTLVAASVLILLSPSDRIPKELAWPSCQKMLSNGLKLIRRIERVDVDAIPAFKWKALLPFLQNEHYDPMFLMEYSSAAATLCAWVLEVLERAQHQDRNATKADDDRREILEELEHLEDEDPVPVTVDTLRPISRNGGSRGSKRVTIGNAEVLFINENEPVSPPSTAASISLNNGGSRPASTSSTTSARRHVLLRTSPWTHRGVTYFVSFFLETSDGQPNDQVLSIKMYEPMSSVESQMFVSLDDLRLDFGDCAADFFERREFGLLCDLVLTRLDGMMAPLPSRGGLSSRGTWHRPSDIVEPDTQTVEYVEAAAVRIQSLIRSSGAKKELQQLKKERAVEDELLQASVRIQCAARQRHARKKVQHVRFAKQHAMGERQQQSATKIQSLARQRLAQKQVAHMKLLQRTPTGLPCSDEDECDQDIDAEDTVTSRLAALQTMTLTEQHEERKEQEVTEEAPPLDDVVSGGGREGGIRPETSMSYASDQFEGDFEADDA